jgi:hypothetical protein
MSIYCFVVVCLFVCFVLFCFPFDSVLFDHGKWTRYGQTVIRLWPDLLCEGVS